MPNLRAHSIIRPKISTMPRHKTEAAEQLELYKMVTKRQRIQQELQVMEQRIKVLRHQLTVLNNEIENSEETIQKLRQSTPSSIENLTAPNTTESTTSPKSRFQSSNFQTFYLEY